MTSRYTMTTLHLAAGSGDVRVTKQLIQQGHSVNGRDETERTPLYLAVSHVRMGVVNELLDWGADCNAQNSRGNTPLHKAVEMGNYKMVRVLLDHGANPLIRNKRGRRPLQVATSTKIRRLLRSNVIQSDSDDNSSDNVRVRSNNVVTSGSTKSPCINIKDEPLALTPPPDMVFSYEAVSDAHSRVEHPLKLKIKVSRGDNLFSRFSQSGVDQTVTVVDDVAPSPPYNDDSSCVPTAMTSSAAASPISVNDEESKVVVIEPEVSHDKTDDRSQIDEPSTTVPDVVFGGSYLVGYHLEDISDPEEDSPVPVRTSSYYNSVPSSSLTWSTDDLPQLDVEEYQSFDNKRTDMLELVMPTLYATSEFATESETRFGIPRCLVSHSTVALSASYRSLADPIKSEVTENVSRHDNSISAGLPELIVESVSASRSVDHLEDCKAVMVTSPGTPSSSPSDEPPHSGTMMSCEQSDNVDSAVYRSNDDCAPTQRAVYGAVEERSETLELQFASTVMTADSTAESVVQVTSDASVDEKTEQPTKRRLARPSPLYMNGGHRREDFRNDVQNHFSEEAIARRNMKRLKVRLRRLDEKQKKQSNRSVSAHQAPSSVQETNPSNNNQDRPDDVETSSSCCLKSEPVGHVTGEDSVDIDDATSRPINAPQRRLPSNPYKRFCDIKQKILENQERLIRGWNDIETICDWTTSCRVTNCLSYTRNYQIHDANVATDNGYKETAILPAFDRMTDDCAHDSKNQSGYTSLDIEQELRKLRLRHLQEQIRLVIFVEHELIRAHSQWHADVTSLTRRPSACVKLIMANDVARGVESDVMNRTVRHPAGGIDEVKTKICRMKEDLLCRQRHEADVLSAIQRRYGELQAKEPLGHRRRGLNNSSLTPWTDISGAREHGCLLDVSIPLVDISGILDMWPQS